MENVRKPGSKLLYYVLLTRCGHCRNLRDTRVEPFKREVPYAQYVVGIARRNIKHPVTGDITHKKGAMIMVKDGTPLTIFSCPLFAHLTFVAKLDFSADCTSFEARPIHHRMPNGKKVECR